MSLHDLQQAALRVKLEESADHADAFIDAAENVAQKHGLDSPSKHRSKSLSVTEWIEGVEKSVGNIDKENIEVSASTNRATDIDAAADQLLSQGGAGRDSPTVDEAVSALAEQMGVELKGPAASDNEAVGRMMAPHADKDFDENVAGKKEKNKSVKFGSASATGAQNNRDQIRYLHMRRTMDSEQAAARASSGGGSVVVITRRSKVSKMLNQADVRSSSTGTGRALISFKNDSQEMMFREMKLVEDNGDAKKKKHRKIIIKGPEKAAEMSNRLSTQSLKAHQEPSKYELLMSAGRKKNIDQREQTYSRFEDAKECTFHPRVRKTAYSDAPQDDDDHHNKKNNNFIERQEAAERGRVNKIQLDIGKSQYEALLDKKFCPQCKAKQSYDDIKEKRKRCNNCNVDYTTAIEWTKVKREFYERQQGMLDGMDKKRQQLAQELERERRRGTKTVYDKRQGKLVVKEYDYVGHAHESKWDDDMEHDFFERNSKMEQKRQIHLKQIEDEMYGNIGVQSTLKSEFSGNDLYDSVSGGSGLFGLDAPTAFLHRYEEDVRRRNAIKAAQREEERERKGRLERTVQDNLCEHSAAFRP